MWARERKDGAKTGGRISKMAEESDAAPPSFGEHGKMPEPPTWRTTGSLAAQTFNN